MKRLITMLCIVAFLAALPLSHVALAAKTPKVDVCHVNSANDTIDLGGGFVAVFGQVTNVSGNAVDAHINHGDSLTFTPFDEAFRDLLEDFYGVSLPNADCYFIVGP